MAGGVCGAAPRDAGAAHAAVVHQQNPCGRPPAAILCQQLVKLRGPAAERARKACVHAGQPGLRNNAEAITPAEEEEATHPLS